MLLFLTFFLISPLSAATVSFLVMETGPEETAGVREFSSLWENGLMDVFFDAGHIVSNAPVMWLPGKPDKDFSGEALSYLDQAEAGGADYFILVLVDYGKAGKGQRKPDAISLRLYKVRPYKLLFEQPYIQGEVLSMKDEFTKVKDTARKLIPHLNDR
jgi:hypothetical protein